jgi:hypothetical protein
MGVKYLYRLLLTGLGLATSAHAQSPVAPPVPPPVAPPVAAPTATGLGLTEILPLVIVGVGVSLVTVEILRRIWKWRKPPRDPRYKDYEFCFWCTCEKTSEEPFAGNGERPGIICQYSCGCDLKELPTLVRRMLENLMRLDVRRGWPEFIQRFSDRETCPRGMKVLVCVRLEGGITYRIMETQIIE